MTFENTCFKPSFTGHDFILKKLYKKGQLPYVKYGLYGENLTRKNVSVEHIQPVSEGGKNDLNNLALTSSEANNKRGVRNLKGFLTPEKIYRYLSQFKFIIPGVFDGFRYIKLLENKFRDLGILPKEESLPSKNIIKSRRRKSKKIPSKES